MRFGPYRYSSLIPPRLPEREVVQVKAFGTNLLNVLQRGYRILSVAVHDIDRVAGALDETFKFAAGEVAAILKTLTLDKERQSLISLWSGGPRHVLTRISGNHVAVDLQGVPWLLNSLFFRINHDQTGRGIVFEESFRVALTRRGWHVHSGPLIAADGTERELDAGVLIGTTLFICECVSVERPLDYEIGMPATIARRVTRLDEKVTQVLTLEDFLTKNPKGRNYDFSAAKQWVGLVVSPFIEWIWDRSPRLWIDQAIPRILSASEAIDFLSNQKPKVQL
jgi:hypothetical protein